MLWGGALWAGKAQKVAIKWAVNRTSIDTESVINARYGRGDWI